MTEEEPAKFLRTLRGYAATVGGCLVALAFFGLPLLLWDFAMLQSAIEKGSLERWSLVNVGLVAVILLFAVLFYVQGRREEDARKHPVCSHGIRDGRAGACAECTEAERTASAERERAWSEAARLGKIRDASLALWQSERKRLDDLRARHIEGLRTMDPREFEDRVAELFRRRGYRVKQTPYTNDHGRDALVYLGKDCFVVECKRYGEGNYVGRPDLQKLFAAVTEEKAKGGILVTTGRLAATAVEYGREFGIELIGPEKLTALMREHFPPTGDETTAKARCPECGEVLTVPVEDSANRRCRAGHVVPHAF